MQDSTRNPNPQNPKPYKRYTQPQPLRLSMAPTLERIGSLLAPDPAWEEQKQGFESFRTRDWG